MLAAAVAKHLDTALTPVKFSESGTGGNCFVGWMPDVPDLAVMVNPTGGQEQPTRDPSDSPTVQVIVRSAKGTQRVGHELAQNIYSTLQCLDRTVLDPAGVDETRVIGTTAEQSAPISLGLDAVGRPEWSLDFVFQIHNPTTHRP